MFKVNNWRRSGAFIVNSEHISHLVLVFLMLTLSREMPAEIVINHSNYFCYADYRDKN